MGSRLRSAHQRTSGPSLTTLAWSVPRLMPCAMRLHHLSRFRSKGHRSPVLRQRDTWLVRDSKARPGSCESPKMLHARARGSLTISVRRRKDGGVASKGRRRPHGSFLCGLYMANRPDGKLDHISAPAWLFPLPLESELTAEPDRLRSWVRHGSPSKSQRQYPAFQNPSPGKLWQRHPTERSRSLAWLSVLIDARLIISPKVET